MGKTLREAIEIMQDLLDEGHQFQPQDCHEAVTLGIEALERHQNKASLTYAGMLAPLPSETEE